MATYKVPVRINHPGAGGDAFNIWHMRVQDQADFNDAMGALDTFYQAIRGAYPLGTTITVGDGIIEDPYGSPTYKSYVPTVYNSSGSSGQAPQLLSVVCSWRTTSATRSGRGRTFLGPLELGVVQNNGTIDTAVLNLIRQSAENLVAASTGVGGWAFGVYSFKDRVLRDFVGVSVRDRFSYLSSRRD